MVGNHSLPSRLFQPAGWAGPVLSTPRTPSEMPKESERTRADAAVGEIVQFLLADAVDPLVAVHPQEAVVVLQDLEGHVVVQPVPGADGAELAVLEADQAAAVGADPEAPSSSGWIVQMAFWEVPERGLERR